MHDTSNITDVALLVLCVLIAICLKWSYTLSARSGELDAIAQTAKKLGAELLSVHREAAEILVSIQASNTASKDAVIADLLAEATFLSERIPDPRGREVLRRNLTETEELYHLSAVADANGCTGNVKLSLILDHTHSSVRLYNALDEAPLEFPGVSTYVLKEWLEATDLNNTITTQTT